MRRVNTFILLMLIPISAFSFGLEVPGGDPSRIIDHNWFVLEYNEQWEQPQWLAYELTREELTGTTKRIDSFKPDPAIVTGSAELSDYKGSGYDRGHLIPAADLKMSAESMSESFYLSNICPQLPAFNRGIWLELESCVRTWAWEYDSVYIVTGPVIAAGPVETIGENEVAVPPYFFKVILDASGPDKKAIGFFLPNEDCAHPLTKYAVSVDRVEQITGLDFYYQLPDDIETALEAEYDITDWNFTEFDFRSRPAIDTQNPAEAEYLYWINSGSGTRHNPSCKYYGNTKKGYYTNGKTGKACGFCGG
ncbi:MAG: DNA/RNA non-specific endonuclease [Spirochaetales bacterium]|nr:DNA/RNA non-specific endonuclease [Spirochaetales bacterium]